MVIGEPFLIFRAMAGRWRWAVGYQADADVLDDDFKENELAARSRAALSERFSAGQWAGELNDL